MCSWCLVLPMGIAVLSGFVLDCFVVVTEHSCSWITHVFSVRFRGYVLFSFERLRAATRCPQSVRVSTARVSFAVGRCSRHLPSSNVCSSLLFIEVGFRICVRSSIFLFGCLTSSLFLCVCGFGAFTLCESGDTFLVLTLHERREYTFV